MQKGMWLGHGKQLFLHALVDRSIKSDATVIISNTLREIKSIIVGGIVNVMERKKRKWKL